MSGTTHHTYLLKQAYRAHNRHTNLSIFAGLTTYSFLTHNPAFIYHRFIFFTGSIHLAQSTIIFLITPTLPQHTIEFYVLPLWLHSNPNPSTGLHTNPCFRYFLLIQIEHPHRTHPISDDIFSVTPSNFLFREAIKKFLRRHKAYLLNQKKALIAKKVDQLTNQCQKFPFFAPINTPNGDLLVASDMDISQESDITGSYQ